MYYLRCTEAFAFLFTLLMGIVWLNLLYWKSTYDCFLYLVFSFPLLQVILTCWRAVDEDVFHFSYQICCWSCNLYPLILFKSSLFGTINISPNNTLVVYAVSTAVFAAVFMWLQSVYGVFFFMFWWPKYRRFINIKMVFGLREVPTDHLNDDCPICLTALSRDPNRNADRELELQQPPQDSLLLSSQPLLNNLQIVITPCGHYFHLECMKRHQDGRPKSCPNCREPLSLVE